jgi:hypothetical protein
VAVCVEIAVAINVGVRVQVGVYEGVREDVGVFVGGLGVLVGVEPAVTGEEVG